ncbi:hypothetical protein LNKW23_12490 [Paralimibaculum aggregatum]|uniref:Uncharacterized protein n=1 Tax=Paralimibaculum aggregatum TaxID=3036245 RepID=A0ABQ6LFC7_9RHOB|nr:hypothetical protein [Limibaculum sp. NKW23]GMG82036.1 hypothetical protein LNKW23_12490 [Limibaculum sp. NKW23]
MTQPRLRDLLERAVLEPEFRARVAADPEAALAGYELAPEARALLAAGGGLALFTLAGGDAAAAPAAEPAEDPADPAAPAEDPAAPAAQAVEPGAPVEAVEPGAPAAPAEPAPMPAAAAAEAEIGALRFLLRVMTGVQAADGGLAQLHLAATLSGLAPGEDPAGLPQPEVSAEALPGDRLPDDLIEIRIAPGVTRGAEGGLEARHQYTVTPVSSRPAPAPAEPPPPPDIAGLAAAVRAAAPESRHDRLLDLVAALDGGAGDA